MMQAANADVPRISIEKAREPVTNHALVVDVRDASEVEKNRQDRARCTSPGACWNFASAQSLNAPRL